MRQHTVIIATWPLFCRHAIALHSPNVLFPLRLEPSSGVQDRHGSPSSQPVSCAWYGSANSSTSVFPFSFHWSSVITGHFRTRRQWSRTERLLMMTRGFNCSCHLYTLTNASSETRFLNAEGFCLASTYLLALLYLPSYMNYKCQICLWGFYVILC
jgi:hypothetical protein